jgi:hypothetical protein
LVESKKQFISKGAKMESDVPKFSIGVPYQVTCDANNICYLSAGGSANKNVTQDEGSCLSYNQAYGSKAQTTMVKSSDGEFKRT